MHDDELARYSRQLNLASFGYRAQRALRQAHVSLVGLGGLGCPAALYLAAAGVGRLTLIDGDHIESSNLQRQIAFGEDELGQAKAQAAARRCQQLNARLQVEALCAAVDNATIDSLIPPDSQLLLDCTDGYASRYAINQLALQRRLPWISAAAIRWEGQLCSFDPRQPHSPCYACLHPPTLQQRADACAAEGVLGPVVGMIGLAQALEAIKLLSAQGESLVGRLAVLDAWQMQWHNWQLPRRADCPVCGEAPA